MAPSTTQTKKNGSKPRLFKQKEGSSPTDSPSSTSKNNPGDTHGATSQNGQQNGQTNGGSSQHHRLDKFGFIVNMDSHGKLVNEHDDDDHNGDRLHPRSSSKGVPSFQEYKTTQRREKKWGHMMVRWVVPDPVRQTGQKAVQAVTEPLTPPRHKPVERVEDVHAPPASATRVRHKVHRRKVVTRLRKGVPDHIRGQVWQYLCRVPQRMKAYPGKYKSYVEKAIAQHEEAAHHSEQQRLLQQQQQQQDDEPRSSSKSLNNETTNQNASYIVKHAKSFKNIQDTIERDIHRTYPRHHLFFEESETSVDEDEEAAAHMVVSASASGGSASADRNNDVDGAISPASAASTMQRNPALRRSHSPQEAPNRPVTSLEDEEDEAHRHGDHARNDMAVTVNTSAAALDDSMDMGVESSLAFCGPNEEISNMIRELEGVVVGDSPTAAATSLHNHNDAQADPVPAVPHSVLPARVADAVGGQASLRRVLKAYSVYDRDIGYCQGMNFVAGMFLTLMPEEESFWLLVSVMNDPPCRMRGLFGEGMRETHLVLFVAERLIQHYLPKIYQHLEREHVHITMFATQWLLTQYTSSFRFDLVLRVWDAFLGEGWKVTYRVMLAILKLHETTILASSFEDILALFREIPDRVTGHSVMETALKIPLRRQLMRKLEQEWYLQQKAELSSQQSPRSPSVASPASTDSPAAAPMSSSNKGRNKKRSGRNKKSQ